jgi:rod shape-determining protein MreD
VIRDLSLLLIASVLLTLESAVGSVTRIGPAMPNFVLPIVIYLGITQEIPLWRVALLSALLGMLVDTASGNALGLMTFLHVATLVATRAGSLRLLMRGRLSQVAITALLAALGALLVIALRSVLRANPQVPSTSTQHWLIATLVPSLTTGLVAPFVIQLARRVDARSRRDEPATLARRAPSEA